MLITFIAFCGTAFGDDPRLPSARVSPEHQRQYADLAVTWMQQYLRINTTNPPGNEMKAANFFKKICDELNDEFRVANYSGTDNALYAAIREVSGKYFPGTPVVPHITSGYTENQRYRPLGIVAYGFNPYTATEEEGNTEHGNDERIRVEEVRRGPQILFDVVARVAAQ